MGKVELKGVGDKSVSVETGLFIDNEFVTAREGTTVEVTNPTNKTLLANISSARLADVELAVQSSKRAFDSWKNVLPAVRGQLLHRLADLFERDADDLASLEALDLGVLFLESKNLHVPQAIEVLRYFAGWTDKVTGKMLHIPQGYAYTRREPLGVCAAIVPWNAPLMITIWKLAPAIAAGNTIIIKTPEMVPLWGQKLAELVKEVGFPPGVINVICGPGRVVGQALAKHRDIQKIAFTGSTSVGRQIMAAAAASNLKKVTLELGGKGPSIVFPDANLENALFWTTLGFTANNGQVCAAGSRIYVHSSIYDDFAAKFAAKISEAVMGDPLLPETTKGPIVSNCQKESIVQFINGAKKANLRLLSSGIGEITSDDNFLPNFAFADVPDDAQIMREEIFGPVAAIAKFDTDEEAIIKANNSVYGLSAAIFTNGSNRAFKVTSGIESGQVTVNCWGLLNANTPFGGVKESGFGRDMGEEALDGWLKTKTVKHWVL